MVAAHMKKIRRRKTQSIIGVISIFGSSLDDNFNPRMTILQIPSIRPEGGILPAAMFRIR